MLVKRFLYKQLYPNTKESFLEALKKGCLDIGSRIHVFHSAVATFHAPSDISGVYGMQCEHSEMDLLDMTVYISIQIQRLKRYKALR